jgi:predicted RNase H-like HicB family nuclease
MPDPTHYTYRVAWSVEDGEHVATVAEFPSLSWLAPTPVEALAGLADVVRDVLADLAASGEPVPAPLSERAYSGRFVVRVPAEVHRRLVREAAEQHVSLNRLVSDRLARALWSRWGHRSKRTCSSSTDLAWSRSASRVANVASARCRGSASENFNPARAFSSISGRHSRSFT